MGFKGHNHSEKSKRKNILSHLGKHHSEETKRKISRALKNKPLLEKTKRKISEALKGRTIPDVVRKKMSAAKLGKNHPFYNKHHSEEVKNKIRNALKGKKRIPFSKEHREKLSKCQKGKKRKPLSDETKHKLRLLAIGRKLIPPSDAVKRKMRIARQNCLMKDGTNIVKGNQEEYLLKTLESIKQITIDTKFKIIGYFPDGYCHETNTIYEVYEPHHFNQVEHDLQRQHNIVTELNCNFIIIYDKDSCKHFIKDI